MDPSRLWWALSQGNDYRRDEANIYGTVVGAFKNTPEMCSSERRLYTPFWASLCVVVVGVPLSKLC